MPHDRRAQAELLESIQDDIVYVIECLLHRYTGEAKGEMTSLIETIAALPGLDAHLKHVLSASLNATLSALRVDDFQSARDGLITLRRRVANTRLYLRDAPLKYNYADVLAADVR